MAFAFVIGRRVEATIAVASILCGLLGCSSSAESEPASAGKEPGAGTPASYTPSPPSASEPAGFCARQCIESDRPKCEAWAKDYSVAFLAAYEACGDNPACIDPKLENATPTDRQSRLAEDYCKPCGGKSDPTCVDRFWKKDGPGDTLRVYSDERLDDIHTKCFPDLAKNKGSLMAKELCSLSMVTCTTEFLKPLGTVICRKRQ